MKIYLVSNTLKSEVLIFFNKQSFNIESLKSVSEHSLTNP